MTPAPANFTFTPPAGSHMQSTTGWGMPAGAAAGGQGSGGQVIGKDWLSVAVLPASVLSGLNGNAANAAGQAARSAAGAGAGVDNAAVLAALMRSATPVHGTWGSCKLLRTSLLTVLITGNGHVLAGAVSPAVLYAAAAQVK